MRQWLQAVILGVACIQMPAGPAIAQSTGAAAEPAKEFVATPRETALGTVFLVRPAWDEAIARTVGELRSSICEEREKGKTICYISIPLTPRGGGYGRINAEISECTKKRLETQYGKNRFWALAPGAVEAKLPSLGGKDPEGGEYMYMWTQVLVGDDGKGSGFDMVYFVGPADVHAFFRIGTTAVMESLDAYVTKRAQADAEFNREVASVPPARRNFLRYYGIRASATYSKGCHDEWNIFRLVNCRREIGDQIAIYFDGRQASPAEGETLVRAGYEQQNARPDKAYSLKDLNEQLVMATLWVQTSAEYRALCMQSYNAARMMLDKDLAEVKADRQRIVIVDADETTIQANEYEASLIGKDAEYHAGWRDWVASASGKAIPGAVEFLNYAASKGVETYYVTNRKIDTEYQGTLDNLKKLGYPFVDDEHVMYRREGCNDNKQPRLRALGDKYHIVLLVGDNLEDFPIDMFEKPVAERHQIAEHYKDDWGKKFIVLPNPMYGAWERAIKDYKKGVSAQEQDRLRKAFLRKWQPKP